VSLQFGFTRRPAVCEATDRDGIVESWEGNYISVRYGDGPGDVVWLRPCDFDGGVQPSGELVTLYYDTRASWGLWRAKPRAGTAKDALSAVAD
jgi:hypothetical protein